MNRHRLLTVFVLVMLAASASVWAQMSPEEARKALEASKPTYEQLEADNARLRTEVAQLRRELATAKANAQPATPAPEDAPVAVAAAEPEARAILTSPGAVVDALPGAIADIRKTLTDEMTGRRVAFNLDRLTVRDNTAFVTGLTHKHGQTDWHIRITARPVVDADAARRMVGKINYVQISQRGEGLDLLMFIDVESPGVEPAGTR